MTSIPNVGAADARGLAQVYQQLAVSRREAAQQVPSESKTRTSPAEEAKEKPAERLAEAGSEGTGQRVNTVA